MFKYTSLNVDDGTFSLDIGFDEKNTPLWHTLQYKVYDEEARTFRETIVSDVAEYITGTVLPEMRNFILNKKFSDEFIFNHDGDELILFADYSDEIREIIEAAIAAKYI